MCISFASKVYELQSEVHIAMILWPSICSNFVPAVAENPLSHLSELCACMHLFLDHHTFLSVTPGTSDVWLKAIAVLKTIALLTM